MTMRLAASLSFILSFTALPALADQLPVKRIILSTSGLAHFEHQGHVSGNTTLDLPVRLDQVDDLMKSLLVFDSVGRLGGVSVPGRTPLPQAFRDLPFSQVELGSPVALLNALKGSAIKITGNRRMEGLLVSVLAEQAQAEGGIDLTRHRVTLMGPQGLQSVVLEDLSTIQFVDQAVQDQLARGLQAIFAHRVQDQRTLSVQLMGEGKRDVALSYVVKAPLWKSTYRMVLPEQDKPDGMLQGWAVLENMSGTDWDDVDITLVSGNPVTFRQSLYTSYYAPRPELPVEVMGRIMPRLDKGALGDLNEVRRYDDRAKYEGMSDGDRIRHSIARELTENPDKVLALQGLSIGADGSVSINETEETPTELRMAARPFPTDFDNGGLYAEDGVYLGHPSVRRMAGPALEQAAVASDAATQVLFEFPDPLTVKSGHSLMLPFASTSIPTEQLWLYQPDTHVEHPLTTIRVTNTTDAGLPPGILTLYVPTAAGTTYIGDAQMPVIPKGEDRLISYALDAKTRIDHQLAITRNVTEASLSEGILYQKTSLRRTTTYLIKAPAEEDRTIILEHPRIQGWTLDGEDDGIELTPNHYRIRLTVPAGEVTRHTVTLSRVTTDKAGLIEPSEGKITYYMNAIGDINPALTEAFTQMATMRRAIDQTRSKVSRLEKERNGIREKWQDNRNNFSSFGSDTRVGRRIQKTMNEQMDRMDSIDLELEALSKTLVQQQQRLKTYIAELDL
ncbi:MAG: hypothetical protein Alpg2KO_19600 [Alphaproteobacteria bacterium]